MTRAAVAVLALSLMVGGCASTPRLSSSELQRYRLLGVTDEDIARCQASLKGRADEIADAMIENGPGYFDEGARSIGAHVGAGLRARQLAHHELKDCLDRRVREAGKGRQV